MRSKLKFLLALAPGASTQALDAGLRAAETRILSAQPGIGVLRATRVDDATLQKIGAGAFDAAEPLDAQFEIISTHADPAALVPLADALRESLAGLVDPARSVALAGQELQVSTGDGLLLVTIANRRLPQFDHAGFIDYWRNNHSEFAQGNVPPEVGLGYRQFHTDEAATQDLLAITGFAIGDFDGAAECHYRDADGVKMLMGMEDVVARATEDERRFVDHARCATSVMMIAGDSSGHQLGG